jgi:hypothetical protein
MHIVSRPRSEVLTVKFNNKYFEVRLDGEAYVPDDLGQFMVAKGLVMQGPNPNPKPRWEMNGKAHGDLLPNVRTMVQGSVTTRRDQC